MREFDETGLKLCKIQAEIFESSFTKVDCSSLVFMRRFMISQVAQRMDLDGFMFEACDVNQAIEEVNSEFGISSYGKKKYSQAELYWIGYIYRYWSYTYQKTSKQVYRIMKPKELRELYYPYHSLDPAQAIERIMEAKGIDDKNIIAKGVMIMRNKMKKEKTQN